MTAIVLILAFTRPGSLRIFRALVGSRCNFEVSELRGHKDKVGNRKAFRNRLGKSPGDRLPRGDRGRHRQTLNDC
jgi:hypothetical protein